MKDVPSACAPTNCVAVLALCSVCLLLTACAYDWKVSDAGQTQDGSGDLDAASDSNHASPEADGDMPRSTPSREDRDAGGAGDADSADDPDADASASLKDASGLDADPASALDASASDSAVGSSSDAQQVVDAGPDAAAQAFSCAHLDAAFCQSFERDSLDVFSWQELTPDSGASVSLVADGSSPGSFALKSALDGMADEGARAVVGLTNGAPSWFRASFDFLPSLSLPASGDEHIFWFRLTEQSGDAYRGVFLGSRGDGTYLILQNFDGTNETWDPYPTAALPAGWVHVELELRTGASGNATVRYNGAVALTFTGAVQVVNVEQSFVQLGLYAEPATISSALYDNVVIEFAP